MIPPGILARKYGISTPTVIEHRKRAGVYKPLIRGRRNGAVAPKAKKKVAAKPAVAIAKVNGAPAPGVWDKDKAGMATITVPNEALDRFWHALSWDEKARIVGGCIAGALKERVAL